MAVADEGGLDALSMRAVATRLDVTPMTLYGYFRDKTALLDGLVGHLLDEIGPPHSDVGWREQLHAVAEGARAAARRHPAVFPLLFARPAVTPDAVRVVEPLFRALLDAGVPGQEVPRLERMLSTFVLGFAVSETSGRFSAAAPSPGERRTALSADAIPAHHELGEALDGPVDWDAEFRADLDELLAVVESVAARAASKGGVRRTP